MAYPYVFRAQAPPARPEDHKVNKDPMPASQARGAHPQGTEAGWFGGLGSGERLASACDLVETMDYLYVRVVKARGLPATGAYVEVRVGNHRGTTRRFEGKANPEWN
jgi:hypothetical protein